MDNKEAIKLITDEYVKLFNENPDEFTKFMICLNAQRIVDGEKFIWENSGENWRIMRFIK